MFSESESMAFTNLVLGCQHFSDVIDCNPVCKARRSRRHELHISSRCLLKNNAGLALPAAYPSDWRRLCQSSIQLLLASLNPYMLQFRRPKNIAFSWCLGFVRKLDVQISVSFWHEVGRRDVEYSDFQLFSGSETPSVTRNISKNLALSRGGIALRSSCASDASIIVLACSFLPTHRTLYLFSSLFVDIDPTHRGWFDSSLNCCLSGHSVVQHDRSQHLISFRSSSTYQFWW